MLSLLDVGIAGSAVALDEGIMSFFKTKFAVASAPQGQYSKRRRQGMSAWIWALAGLMVLLAAAFVGLVVSLGALQLTAALAGLILIIPIFWLISAQNLLPVLFVFIFLVQGVAANSLHLHSALWVGSGLAFLFFFRTLLELLMARLGHRAPVAAWSGTGAVILSALIYLGFFFFGLGVGNDTTLQMFSAVRFGLPMFGVLTVLASVKFSEQRLLALWRLIVFITLLQLPMVVYQHFWGYGAIGWDAVVGSFGPGMSPVLVIFSIAALVFMLARWSRGLTSTSMMVGLFVIVMGNLLLGEVKAIAFWIPVALVLILRRQFFKNFGAFVVYSSFIVVFMCGTFVIYKNLYWGESGVAGRTVGEKLQRTGGYFFDPYEIEYATGEVGRFASLYLWYRDPTVDGVHRLIGYGPGASATGESTGSGMIAKRYRPLTISATSLAGLLWDVGILGALSFVAIFASAIFAAWRFLRRGDGTIEQQAIVDTSAVVLVLISSTIIYNRNLLVETSTQLLFLFCVGCIVQVCRFSEPSTKAAVASTEARRKARLPARSRVSMDIVHE